MAEAEPQTATVREEDVYEALRECYDPEIPVNIVDLGLIYEVAIQPKRIDVKMTLTALGCPMAGEVMTDVRDHLLLVIACATLVAAIIDSVLYAHAVIAHPAVTNPALPLFQRVAFLLMLAWMNLVAVRLLARAQPPGPSVMM